MDCRNARFSPHENPGLTEHSRNGNYTPKKQISIKMCYNNYILRQRLAFNTLKYHVFAPMGRFQLELIYLYFPPSFHLTVTSTPTRPVENVVITTKGLQDRNNLLLDGRTVENKSKAILIDEVSSHFERLIHMSTIH